jgi:hypothetical protein
MAAHPSGFWSNTLVWIATTVMGVAAILLVVTLF